MQAASLIFSGPTWPGCAPSAGPDPAEAARPQNSISQRKTCSALTICWDGHSRSSAALILTDLAKPQALISGVTRSNAKQRHSNFFQPGVDELCATIPRTGPEAAPLIFFWTTYQKFHQPGARRYLHAIMIGMGAIPEAAPSYIPY
jgi:hypothetical protein